jgi:predicted nucleotidyltransferase
LFAFPPGSSSDYDFLVVVDKMNEGIEDVVIDVSAKLLTEYSELIGPIILDEAEWEDRQKYPIGINILKEGKDL